MAINSNRKFKSRETGRRYRVDNNYDKEKKYIACLWDEKDKTYKLAVNALGDTITGKTIADVQRFVNAEDFWITTWEQWLKS